MDKVSIIIPAYNEEKRIGETLEAYSAYFGDLNSKEKLDYEILVVINNTTDRTEEIVIKYQEKCKNIRYLNLKPGGKGFAVIEGFKDALKRDNEFIGFVDSDMATSPEECAKLIFAVRGVDGVIASRYVKGAKISPKPTIQRLIARRMFNILVRGCLFLPYKDTQCGAKFFKRKAVEMIVPKLTMSEWAFDVELLYLLRKNGFITKEFPTVWVDKEYSTINFWNAGPWMALGVVRLRLINSPFKAFVRVYDKLVGFVPR